MRQLFKAHGLYFSHALPWQVELYGFDGWAKGDCIANTMRKIIQDKDKSEWAYEALLKCWGLLAAGRRWPTILDHENDAKNQIDRYWSKLWHRLGKRKHEKHRPAGSLTRDPYIYVFTCAVFLDRIQLIEQLRIKWWLYRPGVFAWRRYLIRRTVWNYFWWKVGTINILKRPDYVYQLREMMELAVAMRYKEPLNIFGFHLHHTRPRWSGVNTEKK